MNKTNLLSGILAVGSMVVAGVAIRKVCVQKGLTDHAWDCYLEVKTELDNELEATKNELDKTIELLRQSVEVNEDLLEIHEQQQQTIKSLREEIFNIVLED